MRIGMLLEQALAPIPGGTGRYSLEMAAALADCPDVTVRSWTAWHHDLTPARLPGVDGPRRLPLPGRGLIAAWDRQPWPTPSVNGLDVFYAPTLLFPPDPGRPLVVTIHDTVPWTHPGTLTPRGVRWHRAMAQRAVTSAEAVVVPTRAVARELARFLDLRRVEVVGEGVSRAFTSVVSAAEGTERRARLALPPGGYLLSLATIEPRKGLDVLIKAASRTTAPDLPVVVVGQAGWGGVDPRAVAEQAGLPPARLRLLGRVNDRDLVEVVRGATVLVVPSRAEGFGLPVLEGMALGVPVVTSDAPALVEVGGDATRSVPVGDDRALADCLAQVLGSPAELAAMRAAGLRRAAEHTWSAAAGRLVTLLDDVLAGP